MTPEEKAVWGRELGNRDLTLDEMERLLRYASDLTVGRLKLEEYEEGVTVFGSARVKEGDPNYAAARELGGKLAKAGQLVITGGSGGIMEAANRGAFEAGGRSLGFNIKLPNEQAANPYLTDEVTFNYFFARKVMLVDAGKVWVYFPGGFGTLDEFTEVMTLMQTGKTTPAPIFLVGKDYWAHFDDFVHSNLLPAAYISPEDENLYTITDDLDEIVAAATARQSRNIAKVVGSGESLMSVSV
jgi:uncharacterized protein (TIGR00730 family)